MLNDLTAIRSPVFSGSKSFWGRRRGRGCLCLYSFVVHLVDRYIGSFLLPEAKSIRQKWAIITKMSRTTSLATFQPVTRALRFVSSHLLRQSLTSIFLDYASVSLSCLPLVLSLLGLCLVSPWSLSCLFLAFVLSLLGLCFVSP